MVLVGGLVSVTGLAFWGFTDYFASIGEPTPSSTIVYRTLQLYALDAGELTGTVPVPLEIARFAAPLVAAYTLIQVGARLFATTVEHWKIRRLHDHVVVIGLDECGRRVCLDLITRGERVVGLDPESGEVDVLREAGVLVDSGDPLNTEVLSRCRVERARHLIVRAVDDATSAQIVSTVVGFVLAQPTTALGQRSISCTGVLSDPDLWTLLTVQEMQRGIGDHIRVDFLDLVGMAIADTVRTVRPTSGTGNTETPVRHLVSGTGNTAERVLLALTRQVPVTWLGIDKNWVGQARHRNPELLGRDITEARDADALRTHLSGPVMAYICDDEIGDGVRRVNELRSLLSDDSHIVLVRWRQDGLTNLIDFEAGVLGCAVSSVSLDRVVCSLDMFLHGTGEVLGRALHERYLAERAQGGASTDDPALVPWSRLPETLRESNRDQARHIVEKLWTIGRILTPLSGPGPEEFTPEEIELLSRVEHDRWVAERRRNGWRSGPRDVEARTTPYLVSWEELTEEIRDLDRLFIRTLPATLATIGLQASRIRGEPATTR
jgi:voltage-gated potassium channel Kch